MTRSPAPLCPERLSNSPRRYYAITDVLSISPLFNLFRRHPCQATSSSSSQLDRGFFCAAGYNGRRHRHTYCMHTYTDANSPDVHRRVGDRPVALRLCRSVVCRAAAQLRIVECACKRNFECQRVGAVEAAHGVRKPEYVKKKLEVSARRRCGPVASPSVPTGRLRHRPDANGKISQHRSVCSRHLYHTD